MLFLSHSFILPTICNCFARQQYTLSMSALVGNLFPTALNFFHHSVNKKLPCVCYCLGEANFCLRSQRKINSHKLEGFGLMSPLQVMFQRQHSSLLLYSSYFFRNYHNIKYITSHKLHRCFKNSVKHTKFDPFLQIQLANSLYLLAIFPKKLV